MVSSRVSALSLAALAAGLALAACQGNPDSWGTGVVKQTDAFGDYSETVVSVPKPTAGPRQFECTGPFAPNTTAINIAADFGQANVITGNIMSPDGSTAPGIILLPNDPALSLEIAWKDPANMVAPRRVAFTESSAWTVNGIGIGTSLSDLERANGKPFRIQGFGGNSGGVVADWRGGRLGNLGGGCVLGVQMALSAGASDGAQARISGPKVYASNDPAIRAANPSVGVFWVNYR
ncbi:hypothetical protein LJE71_11560 [Xanthobacter autotrophicus]|uniref:hypothetical protein n=1 Tax=Xanthobacter TaxID=279 RepID=UPI001E421E58|nr:hypothetical protein [Xanthobacter autotrophicus]UDQ91581.1 hypothetical protein LJE71_11560 [Xanthobacter autotrophicus]